MNRDQGGEQSLQRLARRSDLSFQQRARTRANFIQKMSKNNQSPDSLQFTQKRGSTSDRSDASQRLAFLSKRRDFSFRRLSSLLHEREDSLRRLNYFAEKKRDSSQRLVPLYTDIEVLRQDGFIDSGQTPANKRDQAPAVNLEGIDYLPNDYIYSRQKDFTGKAKRKTVDNGDMNGTPVQSNKGRFQNDDLKSLQLVLLSDRDEAGGTVDEEDNLTIDLLSKTKTNVPYIKERMSISVQPSVNQMNDLFDTREDAPTLGDQETLKLLDDLQLLLDELLVNPRSTDVSDKQPQQSTYSEPDSLPFINERFDRESIKYNQEEEVHHNNVEKREQGWFIQYGKRSHDANKDKELAERGTSHYDNELTMNKRMSHLENELSIKYRRMSRHLNDELSIHRNTPHLINDELDRMEPQLDSEVTMNRRNVVKKRQQGWYTQYGKRSVLSALT